MTFPRLFCSIKLIIERTIPAVSLVGFALLAALLTGCERGPKLPDNYGAYFEQGGKWIPIRDLRQDAVLVPEQRFLIFSPLTAQIPDPQRLAELHPTMWIRTRIEAQSRTRESEPIAYHVEPGGGVWIEENRVYPLDFGPDPKNPKALYIQPRQPLTHGVYALQVVGDGGEPMRITFWVGSSDPQQLPGNSIRDEWIYTLNEKADELSKLGAFAFGPSPGSAGRREYNERMVIKSEVKPVEAVTALEQQLRARCEQAFKAPLSEESLQEGFRAALVYQTLSSVEGGRAVAQARARLEAPILEAARQKDWLLVLHYQQLATRFGVGDEAQSALRDAGEEIAKAESEARQSLQNAVADSAKPGKQIAQFKARTTSFGENDFTITVNEGTITWREPRYIGGPRDGKIEVRRILSAVAGEDETTVNTILDPKKPRLKTAKVESQRGDGSIEEHFTFASSQERDAFLAKVISAKQSIESKHPHLFEVTATARPIIWGERIFVGGSPWDYTVTKPESTLELESDSGDTAVYAPGKSTSLTASEWIRIRSMEAHPTQIVIHRFPRLRDAGKLSASSTEEPTGEKRIEGDERRTFSTPNPTARGRATDESVSAYAAHLQSLEDAQDVDAIIANYADRVDYYDNGIVNKDFIKKDKAEYFARWPRNPRCLTERLQRSRSMEVGGGLTCHSNSEWRMTRESGYPEKSRKRFS